MLNGGRRSAYNRLEVLAEEYRQRRHQEAQLKETKDNFDREWEIFQTPVRNRIGALANDIIETRWAGAKSITKDTSPKFAADVLVNVRQRFYAEIAQEDEAALAAGGPVKTDSPNGPPTRKLILENMKWLFDTKIKPLTDHFQRELFLCNGCDGNFKFYGFEGVIQHYAAKHTTTLSMGNIVVHWRAEWPEHPPSTPILAWPKQPTTRYQRLPQYKLTACGSHMDQRTLGTMARLQRQALRRYLNAIMTTASILLMDTQPPTQDHMQKALRKLFPLKTIRLLIPPTLLAPAILAILATLDLRMDTQAVLPTTPRTRTYHR